MVTIRQLQILLRLTYGLIPIIAGLDKFSNLLVNWTQYLGTHIVSVLPFDAATFMKGIGVIEVIAGLLVLAKPRVGAIVVMVWLILIALQLIGGGNYLDVAVRDLVMAVGAYTLARLTKVNEELNR